MCLMYSVLARTTVCIAKYLCDTVGALSENALPCGPGGRKGSLGKSAEQTEHSRRLLGKGLAVQRLCPWEEDMAVRCYSKAWGWHCSPPGCKAALC